MIRFFGGSLVGFDDFASPRMARPADFQIRKGWVAAGAWGVADGLELPLKKKDGI